MSKKVLIAFAYAFLSVAQTNLVMASEAEHNWVEIQKKSKDAMVQVFSTVSPFNWLEPYRVPEQGEGRGSGFFIDNEGHFVTNYHVVAQASRVQVSVPILGTERLDATVVGVSPELDVALVRLDKDGLKAIRKKLKSIPYFELGNSNNVVRGQEILALGYPLGEENLKSSQGTISGWARVALAAQGFNDICFQTTAAINPGNSGGPSLGANGEVIGINFAVTINAQNISYIIPINHVKSYINKMSSCRLERKPNLGISFLPVSKNMTEFFSLNEDGGLYVSSVISGSFFEQIGIKQGDLILEINGHTFDSMGNTDVNWSEDKVPGSDVLGRLAAGDDVSMIVSRNENREELNFKLEAGTISPVRLMFPECEKVDYEILAGLCIMELSFNHLFFQAFMINNTPGLGKYASEGNRNKNALIVTNILQASEVTNCSRLLKAGVLVKEVNGKKVSTLEELRAAIKSGLSSDFMTLLTDDNNFVVVSVVKALKDEPRLAKQFLFDKDHSAILAHTLNKGLDPK
jgi:serine protease Do